MKSQLNEIERMQQLAGILNENLVTTDQIVNAVYKQFLDDQKAGHTTEKQVDKAGEYIHRNRLRVAKIYKEQGLGFAVEYVYKAISGTLRNW